MSYAQDLTGKRFGRLLVISRNYEKQKELYGKTNKQKAFWNCICDCGNRKVVESSSLNNKTNPTLSCGCYKIEVSHKQKNTQNITWIHKQNVTLGITHSGKTFSIDTDDFDKVKDYCWRIDKKVMWLPIQEMELTQ